MKNISFPSDSSSLAEKLSDAGLAGRMASAAGAIFSELGCNTDDVDYIGSDAVPELQGLDMPEKLVLASLGEVENVCQRRLDWAVSLVWWPGLTCPALSVDSISYGVAFWLPLPKSCRSKEDALDWVAEKMPRSLADESAHSEAFLAALRAKKVFGGWTLAVEWPAA